MFVGREEELAKLENLYQKDAFQMVVVYGRRRVGKTALINRFASDKRALYFTALDQADGITSLISAASYMSSLGCRAGPGPLSRGMPPSTSWRSAPSLRGSCSYSTSFPTPPGATAPCLLCFRLRLTASSRRRTSSLSCAAATRGSWRARSSVGRAPLYGRRTAQLKVTQLGYLDASKMLPGLDPQEQFRYYGCFGGVPYYLEQVDPALSLQDNLAALYFDPMGFLYEEPYGQLR